MINLNLLFNKLYYKNLNSTRELENDIKQYNERLFGENLFDPQKDYIKPIAETVYFRLETAYPGMIIGSGNSHGVHKTDNDINMGFSFDFVTGQPYIPGSSVKGVLRSCFEQYPDVIRELTGCADLDIKALVNELFEGDDVFLDAVIYRGDARGRLIGEDYITPHSDPLKDPNPIHIIKIMPGVVLEFRFIPKPSEKTDMISAEAKIKLYKALLKLFGVGAKTNVGYGILREYDSTRDSQRSRAQQAPSVRNSHNTTQATTVRTNSANTGDGNITMKKCEHCGWKNYKFERNQDGTISNRINDNWKNNTCKRCERSLNLI